MTKMSKAQRTAILDFHNGVTSKQYTMIANARTIAALVRNGWATYQVQAAARLRRYYPERSAFVTRAGLIAAGVDIDAAHAEALAEDFERYQGVTERVIKIPASATLVQDGDNDRWDRVGADLWRLRASADDPITTAELERQYGGFLVLTTAARVERQS